MLENNSLNLGGVDPLAGRDDGEELREIADSLRAIHTGIENLRAFARTEEDSDGLF